MGTGSHFKIYQPSIFNTDSEIKLFKNTIHFDSGYSVFNGPITGRSSITGNSIVKYGGLSTEYLMANGSSLQYSQNSGNSNFYLYDNSDGITTPPPLNGHIGYNNATQANATILYISHLTSDGIDIGIYFNQLTQIQDVYLQDKNSSLNFIKYNITGTPTIIPNSYISIPVSYTIGNGGGSGTASFGDDTPLIISFFTNSIEVDTRLTTLETKTQNQTATPTTTTMTGTTNINSVYTLPNTAPAVGQVMTCGSLGVANWITPTASSFSSIYPYPTSIRTVALGGATRTLCATYTMTSNITFTTASLFFPVIGSDVSRVGIYRGDLTTATLVGQTASSVPLSAYTTRTLTLVVGQSLTFTIGQQIVIAFATNGSSGTNTSTTTGPLNIGVAFISGTSYSAAGFPALISGIASPAATSIRMCMDLL